MQRNMKIFSTQITVLIFVFSSCLSIARSDSPNKYTRKIENPEISTGQRAGAQDYPWLQGVKNFQPTIESLPLGNTVDGLPAARPGLELPADERIINGLVAKRGQFPWQVRLLMYGDGYVWFCGGSLVSKRYVLTAGHCVKDFSSFDVFFNAQNMSDMTESGRINMTTTHKILHEKFNHETLDNDIALLKLPTSVNFTEGIQPIRLPRASKNSSNTYEGAKGFVSGWGATTDMSSNSSDLLRFVQIPVISNAECGQVYGEHVIIPSKMCCSGEGSFSSCIGDSGGPLAIKEDEKYTLIGVTSFVSAKGCESGEPSAYTRITNYLSWIHKHART